MEVRIDEKGAKAVTGKKELRGYKKESKLIRVSREVFGELSSVRGQFQSWDGLLRYILGMRGRGDDSNQAYTVWFLRESARGFEKLSEARGEAIKIAARRGLEHVPKPIKMREAL